jgi:hypothetical protein
MADHGVAGSWVICVGSTGAIALLKKICFCIDEIPVAWEKDWVLCWQREFLPPPRNLRKKLNEEMLLKDDFRWGVVKLKM